jgi:hypothetical protein
MAVPGWGLKHDPPSNLPALIDFLATRVGWLRDFCHAQPRRFDDRLRAEVVSQFGLTDPGGDGGIALSYSAPAFAVRQQVPALMVMRYALVLVHNMQFWLDHNGVSGYPVWTDVSWADPSSPGVGNTFLELDVHFSLLLNFLRAAETLTETRGDGSGAAEALPDSWSRMVHGAIEAARRAWFDGYAVIVAEINSVLVERDTELQVAAELPAGGRTLIDCRRRWAQAFRDIPGEVSQLPDADKDQWKPWSVGFINDQTNPAVSIGANFVNVTGEELAHIVEFLRQKPKEWPWQSNLVEPIEQDAIQAAQAFDAMLARIGSLGRQAGAAVPAVELVGPHPPNQFHWNKRSCEMPPLPWRLVNALWLKKSVLEDDVFEAVWPGATRSESALKTAISRVNTIFLEAKIPILLSRKNGYVLLTIVENA